MNFAILFHTEDKSCEQIRPEELSLDSLDPSNFAWLDFDLNQQQEIKDLFHAIGFLQDDIKGILDPDTPFYIRHGQWCIVEKFHVCVEKDESILSSPFIIAMTDRLIITAHHGPSIYVENVLKMYEESFKSVGKSPGFIYFLLWDNVVDGFLPQIFCIDEKLEQLEELYLNGSDSDNILNDIIGAKQMVRTLKQSLSPMQRSMRSIVGSKLGLVSDEARKHLHGLFEHMDRLASSIDSLQDRVHATLSGYNSILSQQINNSMKVLAIIATIMMPLSLLAGIYGTNFEYIPELSWKYGYFIFIGLLFLMASCMLFIFKKNKWL